MKKIPNTNPEREKKYDEIDDLSLTVVAISSIPFLVLGWYMWKKTGSVWLGIAGWLPPSVFTSAFIEGVLKIKRLGNNKNRKDILYVFSIAISRAAFGLFIGLGIMGGLYYQSIWIGILLWIVPTLLIIVTSMHYNG